MPKKDKIKPTHSLISNVLYLFRLQIKYVKLSFIFLILLIPIVLSLSYCSIYMPKLVVSEIMNKTALPYMVMKIGSIGLLIIFLNVSKQLIETYNSALMTRLNTSIMILKTNKTVYTDYENIESPKCRNMMKRADDVIWGTGEGSAVERMAKGAAGLITDILGFLLFGTIISFVNPWIAVILIITQLVNFFLIRSVQKFQYKSRDHITLLDRKLWYIANNSGSFDSAKDVRMYGMNTWFIRMYKEFTREHLNWDKKTAKKYFLPDVFNALIILLRDGFAYAVLIYMVINGRISVDYFIFYFGAIVSFANWISGIINKFSEINDISLSVCDLRDYLDYHERNKKEGGCRLISNDDILYEIELKNISYRYAGAKNNTLSDISIKINPGEKIAIVGLNGAGKTTLIKIICGLYNPTSGTVFVNKHNKNDYNIYNYYSMFSVVFQDFHFLPVSIANTVSSKSDEQTDRKRVLECIGLAGLMKKIIQLDKGIDSMLNKQLNKNGIDLSGGEKQKLLLARAIYKDAPILILDEPASAIDPIAEAELYQKYDELTKDKTSIYISHRLSSTRFCDRILFMENGRIAETGTHNELMKIGGKYANLFKIQSHYYKNENGGAENEEA